MGDFGRLARGTAAAVTAMFMAGTALSQDGIRMIDGSLTYRERIALPDGALAVIEARDALGRPLGEATLGTRGAQVPLGFQIAVPEGMDAELRAALIVGGRPEWYVSDIAIPAGTDPVSLGDIMLSRYLSMGLGTTFRCGALELAVGFFDANAVLAIDGRRLVLEPVAAETGARFEAPGDPGTWVWSRGGGVLVSLDGEELPACSVIPPDAPGSYEAQGSGPDWSLRVENGSITLDPGDGTGTVAAPLPEARFQDGAFLYEIPSAGLTIRITRELCRDVTTGMPFPDTVTATLDGRRLSGCGGNPIELLTGAEWVVEDIARRGIIDSSRVTLTFGEEGDLGGMASCNRYATRFEAGRAGASVGQIAATQALCAEALMNQEQVFFAALASIARFDIDATGALLLYDSVLPEPMLTARR
jgi:heat shock protein HslJ/uncharacterized lipoprotein YbaY